MQSNYAFTVLMFSTRCITIANQNRKVQTESIKNNYSPHPTAVNTASADVLTTEGSFWVVAQCSLAEGPWMPNSKQGLGSGAGNISKY